MKSNIASTKVEKTVSEVHLKLFNTVKDYTPPLTFDNYLLIKKISQENDVNHIHVIKVLGHRDYGLEDKIEDYESRIRMHKHDSE